MRRLLAILILCLLPLQWSYAVVAQYCAHEQSATAGQHMGHHDHEHVDDAGTQDDDAGGLGDADCPTCHHLCGNTVAVAISTPVLDPANTAPSPHFQSCPSRSPDNPFRPPLAAGF